jgi:hypothetical protein
MPCGKVLRLCKKISFSGQLQFYPNPGHTMTLAGTIIVMVWPGLG